MVWLLMTAVYVLLCASQLFEIHELIMSLIWKKVKSENREIYIYFPCEIKKNFTLLEKGPK